MEHKFEIELEALMQRELNRLPPRKAPASLAPRVMAAIQARSHVPAWRRPIWTWPRRTQWLVALLFLSVLASMFSIASVSVSLAQWTDYLSDWSNTGLALKECGEILLSAVGMVAGSFGQFWTSVILGTALAMYLFCLGTGTLFYQWTVKRN